MNPYVVTLQLLVGASELAKKIVSEARTEAELRDVGFRALVKFHEAFAGRRKGDEDDQLLNELGGTMSTMILEGMLYGLPDSTKVLEGIDRSLKEFIKKAEEANAQTQTSRSSG